MYSTVFTERAVKLGLIEGSRNFNIILKRAENLAKEIAIFEKKIPKITKQRYGRHQARVTYVLMQIQRDSIVHDKEISLPSLAALSIAIGASIRQIQRIINNLISEKKINIANYHLVDSNGEVLTRKTYPYEAKITNGVLRKIINPLKKVADYLQSKITTRRAMAKELTFGSAIVIKNINNYYQRQPSVVYSETFDSPPPSSKYDSVKEEATKNLEWDPIIDQL